MTPKPLKKIGTLSCKLWGHKMTVKNSLERTYGRYGDYVDTFKIVNLDWCSRCGIKREEI